MSTTQSVSAAAKRLGINFVRAYRAKLKTGAVRVKLFGAPVDKIADLRAAFPDAKVYAPNRRFAWQRTSLCVLFPSSAR